jgi:hypothetical protein
MPTTRAQSVAQVQQSSGGPVPPQAAGKNAIINGAFNVWQRGTSFSNPASGSYSADRFNISSDGSGRTSAISQQTFTPGTAPVAGYESAYFLRYAVTVAGTGATAEQIGQRIEDVRTFAGQSVTVSFWAKADSARSITGVVNQNFGSGGSSLVYNAIGATSFTLTTSWARYTMTGTMASIAGKTIGTSSFVDFGIQTPINTTKTIDIWGVQFEQGSTATPFQTASGTIGGELALCQRYYWRTGGDSAYNYYGSGINGSTTIAACTIPNPVTLRVAATSVDYNLIALQEDTTGAIIAVTSITNGLPSKTASSINATVASGLTKYRPVMVLANNSTSSYLGFSAEL